MPREISKLALTVEEMRANEISAQIQNKRKVDKIEKRKIAKMKKSHLRETSINRRVINKIDLRKDTRVSMRIDKEISTHAYSVEENGKYWFKDVKTTLAVITQAKMIIASNKERIYDYGDDNERRTK